MGGNKTLKEKLNAGKEKAVVKEFDVIITETSKMTVTVEAKSREEAEKIASRNWHNDDYLIDAEHFSGVTFEAVPLKYDKSRSGETR